jgi:hypothetical protein
MCNGLQPLPRQLNDQVTQIAEIILHCMMQQASRLRLLQRCQMLPSAQCAASCSCPQKLHGAAMLPCVFENIADTPLCS